MKKKIILASVFSLTFLVFSCASTPTYLYEEKAITLHLKSAPDLNLYNKQAHTLMLCVYQLKDPNAINQLLDEEDGISKLLACKRFDTSSVTHAKQLVMQPDQKVTETFHRFEGTKYVGIVAGYYKGEKKNMVRLKEVPVGLVRKNPKKMKVGLYLGPQEIQEFKVK